MYFSLLVAAVILKTTPTIAACDGPIGGKVGQCAPDFKLASLDGKEVRLSSYRGKVVFLNFWATWCAPCQVEMPAMERANGHISSDQFTMVTVSIDENGKPAIDKFFERVFPGRTPNFSVLLDTERRISTQYGTFKVPETYIIDKTGRVRDRVEGIRDWDDSLIVHYLELLARQ